LGAPIGSAEQVLEIKKRAEGALHSLIRCCFTDMPDSPDMQDPMLSHWVHHKHKTRPDVGALGITRITLPQKTQIAKPRQTNQWGSDFFLIASSF
jgi:hypothetical protein